MTVAFDAASSSGYIAGGADTSWTHTPVGTPSGVLVLIGQGRGTAQIPADQVVGVTYGGVSLTRVGTVGVVSSEGARAYAYFLGSSVPTGAQTVAVDNTPADQYGAYCITLTAAANTEVVDFKTVGAANAANPSTASLSLSGRTCYIAAGYANSLNAITSVAPPSGWSVKQEDDLGSQNTGAYQYDTIGSSDVAASITVVASATALIAVAVSEVVSTAASFAFRRAFPRPILNF